MSNPQLAEEPYKSVRYYRHYRYMIPITIIIIGITITKGSQKLLNKSKRKRNKLCVNEGSEFHKRSVKSWLQDNDLEMCLTHYEGKPAVAEKNVEP